MAATRIKAAGRARRLKRLVFQPETSSRVLFGAEQIINAVRPTLGPRPRQTAIAPLTPGKGPELLDSGGIIARRVVQLPDRDADVGAMLVREMLWQVYDQVGDGTATAAVIFQTVFREGLRYIAAGGSAPRLRAFLDEGLRVVLAELDSLRQPVQGKAALAGVAQAICHDPPLAALLGEILDVIGEHGQLDIRSGRRRGLERDYVEGSYWPGGALSRALLPAGERATQLENAALALTDFDIEDPQELVPLLRLALETKTRHLVLVARKVSDKGLGLLATAVKPDALQVLAVKTPGMTPVDQADALSDMAALTGATPFFRDAGQTLAAVRAEHLGRARSVWANAQNFGLRGGRGDARQLRQHIRALQAAHAGADNPETRRKLQQRLGRMMGGSATLWIGGATDTEIKVRKEVAERTAEAMRGAVREGVLPGGGVALLQCSRTLRQQARAAADPDARAAYGILARALEEPLRVLLANAGYDPSVVLADILRRGDGWGLDVESGQLVEMRAAGVLDSAAVQQTAVRRAVGAAALALTIDVLVHRKIQREAASLVPGKSNDFYEKNR
jgi:chaperonin GroEL